MEGERRIVVLGALQAGDIADGTGSAARWRLVEAASMDAVARLLAAEPQVRVGLWAQRAQASAEAHEGFAALRAKHRRVQWIGLVPRGLSMDDRVAELIASHFFDYLTAPVERARLEACAGHAHGMALVLERAQGRIETADEEIVGTSEPMRQLFRDIRKVAAADAPVLVLGESGTGKELVARAIHERSQRRNGLFVAVDCGAIPATLIQAELFGYEKGAFTGAAQRRAGRIEAAQHGTLFLDEVGDLPLDMQGNLLRFLQESTVQRLGSTKHFPVDARVIAATNVDVEAAVRQGRFREDLYYRLNVLGLRTPALRERHGDIELLARHFLQQFLRDSGKPVVGYSSAALEAMCRHAWPGNIRELINRVRRAIVMCEGRWITAKDLGLDQVFAGTPGAPFVLLQKVREAAEAQALRAALATAGDNYSAAARMLGISRVTLYRLLDKHGLSEPPSSSSH